MEQLWTVRVKRLFAMKKIPQSCSLCHYYISSMIMPDDKTMSGVRYIIDSHSETLFTDTSNEISAIGYDDQLFPVTLFTVEEDGNFYHYVVSADKPDTTPIFDIIVQKLLINPVKELGDPVLSRTTFRGQFLINNMIDPDTFVMHTFDFFHKKTDTIVHSITVYYNSTNVKDFRFFYKKSENFISSFILQNSLVIVTHILIAKKTFPKYLDGDMMKEVLGKIPPKEIINVET